MNIRQIAQQRHYQQYSYCGETSVEIHYSHLSIDQCPLRTLIFYWLQGQTLRIPVFSDYGKRGLVLSGISIQVNTEGIAVVIAKWGYYNNVTGWTTHVVNTRRDAISIVSPEWNEFHPKQWKRV